MAHEASALFLEPSQLATCLIPSVPAGVARPLWSVMIPTYNCAGLLRETLESVLVQAPGPERMQIEVVDDCSTKDDPEGVVRELGGGRVAFYRQPANGGAVRNFNTCVLRSRGRYVHILHGDDLVETDFYQRMAAAAEQYPQAAILAARCCDVDESGAPKAYSPRVPDFEQFSTDPRPLLYQNPFRTPGMVVRRDFYEAHGGFLEPLIHAADWEMWVRAVAEGGIHMLEHPLARYRDFGGNDTSRLARSGENYRDFMRLGSVLAMRYPGFDFEQFQLFVWFLVMGQMRRFRQLGDVEAVTANRRLLAELRRLPMSPARRLKRLVGSIPLVGPAATAIKKRLFDRSPAACTGVVAGSSSQRVSAV